MARLLTVWFLLVLVAMSVVTVWASLDTPIWAIPDEVLHHPWFITTLFDTYFGFLAFFLYVLLREPRSLPRVAWLVAILLLGNFAMSVFALLQIRKLPSGARWTDLFLPVPPPNRNA